MDRKLIYPGAIPLETDLLGASKHAYLGLAKLAGAMFGTGSQFVNGLACTPNSPANLSVNVAPGEIYSLQTLDINGYSSLGTDSSLVVKQGILAATQSLACPAPTTAGFSINYLVQAVFAETDDTPVVLPYYNAANPAQALNGPSGTGATQPTRRANSCVVTVKAGTAALTGTQTTPAPDTNNVGLWVVTVANGQTGVTSANIAQYPGAAFVPQAGAVSNAHNAIYSRNISGNSNITLDPNEAAYPILLLTGALTASINLYVPAMQRQWLVINNTSGNYTVTIITPSGTGKQVFQGYAKHLYCDGINVNDVMPVPADKQIYPVSVSVASNALTIALAPCKLNFRSPTLGSGTVNQRDLTAGVATTISAGSTGGTVGGKLARIWIAAMDNAGAIELAWANVVSYDLDDSDLLSTAAEGGMGTADAVDTWYSTTARSNLPFRILGFFETTQASAGIWAAAPSLVSGALETPAKTDNRYLLQNNPTLGLVETFADPAGARCRRYYDITGLTGMQYNGATINAEYLTVNNTAFTAGAWAGRDVAGPCWAEVMTDLGQKLFFYAASGAAGVVPTWSLAFALDLSTTYASAPPPGTLIQFAGSSAPPGYLVCPTAQTLVSTAAYPALFTALGYTWGGSGTQFGLPYFPADYALVQQGAGAVGTQSVGQVISHNHAITPAGAFAFAGSGSFDGYSYPSFTSATLGTAATGGAANLAAGSRVLICVKY